MYTDFKKNNLKPSTIDFNFNRNKNKNTHPVMEENILKVNLKFMMKVLLNRMTRPVSRYHTHSGCSVFWLALGVYLYYIDINCYCVVILIALVCCGIG